MNFLIRFNVHHCACTTYSIFLEKKNIKNITILINQQYRHWDNEMYIFPM